MAAPASPLVQRILDGDPRALARACTLVENRSAQAADLLKSAFPHTGHAFTVGITGSPGAGKSTLTSALISELRRAGQRVAVVAVDPSSPFSGGAILGDRIRMACHHDDAGVFIRSMATRGALGGLAPTTHDLALLLDAAGFDWILIETVGVGQDEIDVARLAPATAVVLAPGMGDDVQAIKAGILEIADVFVLNKADQPGAARLEQDMHEWPRPLVKTVATTADGLPELLAALETLRAALPPHRTELHWAARLRQMFAERAVARLDANQVDAAARRIAGRECDPYTIIEEWLKV
ncbi:methylmalonyl Co-A mutase-associated GTPase MeaB [uncultured Paludibaculum sp.]|uniref:methylmalonyl Co-A mutase-associated GTPase MeaB n=1 Tax=uncultured Paludibaculum sp. TaxID=1765020 RepID=UPI002AAC339A|nr:methylmalonyl Co-A mutase-associated GTPase MeaB [uncultured Paludibaculum sp.]